MDVVWSVFVKVMLTPVSVTGLVVEKMRLCCRNLREETKTGRHQYFSSQKDKGLNTQRLQIVLDMDQTLINSTITKPDPIKEKEGRDYLVIVNKE